MTNDKQARLKAILDANPNAPAVIQVGADTEGLLPAEIAAIVNGPPWPANTTWMTYYVNCSPWGINVRSGPSRTAPIVGNLADGATVSVAPYQLNAAGYVPVGPDGKTFVFYDLLLSAPVKPIVLIDVPWLSQWTDNHVVGDKHTINDCAIYSLEGLRRWKGLPPIDPVILTAQTTLATSDTGLATSAVVNLANANGLPMTLHNDATWDNIKIELMAGRPVLALILYRPLTGRQDQQDTKGEHFLNVVGFGDDYVIVNDPDFWPTGGKAWRVPLSQFQQAQAQCQPPHQAAFVVPSAPAGPIGYDLYHSNEVDMPTLGLAANFIFHKGSQGVHFIDPAQQQRFAVAKAGNGDLRWGITHFCTNGSVMGQLDNLLSVIPPGCQPVLALDVEHSDDPEGDITLTTLGVLVNGIQTETGQYPLIYTRANYFDALVAASPAATDALQAVMKCDLWIASQNLNSPVLSSAWANWCFQQYAQTLPPGASTVVDTDRFNGTNADLRRWWQAHTVKAPPVVTPAPTTQMSFHYMAGGDNNALLDVLRAGKAADKPLAGLLLMRYGWQGELQPLDVKAASSQTEVMLRTWQSYEAQPDWSKLDLYSAGRQALPAWCKPEPGVDFWQIINEPGYGVGTPSFWQGALDEADARGVKLAVGCFAVGNPKLPDEDPVWWGAFYPVLRRCKAQGHAFMLHEYLLLDPGSNDWSEPWGIMRHKQVYAQFPADLKDLPLRIAEFGTRFGAVSFSAPGLAQKVENAVHYLAEDAYVRWVALWSAGGAGAWAESQLGADKIAAIKGVLFK